ncbi:MAG: hypothetical protein WAP35_04060 [Solirubrobacterales bacterium]
MIASFTMFAVDELSTASTSQTAAVQNGVANAPVVRDAHGREVNPKRTEVRARIDEINDRMTGTAENMVAGESPLVRRVVPFLLGMLMFGFGGHFLANWMEMSRRSPRFGGAAPIETAYTPGYR